MKQIIRIAMAQLDFLVGAPLHNADIVIAAAHRARTQLHADVVVFPELCLCGYPPEDLLLRPSFEHSVQEALRHICAQVRDIDVIVGYPSRADGALYNAASLLRNGEVVATYYKHLLPNYGVFDEKRYFSPGRDACVVDIKGLAVGITICEDVWAPGPAQQARAAGAQLIVNLNASPFHRNKTAERERAVCERARETGLPIVYVNLVGGQDELVFDGESFVVDAQGAVIQRAPAFVEDLTAVEVEYEKQARPRAMTLTPRLNEVESVYRALVLGLRDYVDKNGFRGVVLGLSGGIDSALTLTLAVDALGPARVQAVMMPSRFTAQMSVDDAKSEADALGVAFSIVPIDTLFDTFLAALKPQFAGQPVGVAEENIQARVRGVLLMAISNKGGGMVVTTGNKSEMAVGYATLYGDMAGGFAVIKDVPKTLVYKLARYRNAIAAVIPERVLTRAPSAELAPNQKDSDSLPDYAVLDAIIEQYIEHNVAVEDIVAQGFEPATVRRVVALIHRNEYKRRQAPPGIRITPRAFGRDWRYPITTPFGKN